MEKLKKKLFGPLFIKGDRFLNDSSSWCKQDMKLVGSNLL